MRPVVRMDVILTAGQFGGHMSGVCMCGHAIEKHEDGEGLCDARGCACMGYEEDEFGDLNIGDDDGDEEEDDGNDSEEDPDLEEEVDLDEEEESD